MITVMKVRNTLAVFCYLIVLTCSVAGLPAAAQQPNARAQVLVLGTYHFANPGLDVVKTNVADVLSAPKQAEIEAVVEALTRFRPTKIAVEERPESVARLDSMYAAYRAGKHTLTRNEEQQLGFRIAHRLNHPRLYAIDHDGEFPFNELMAYAQHRDTAFVQWAQTAMGQIGAEQSRWQMEKSVGEILQLENDPKRIAWGHAHYLRFSRVGAGDTYVGATLLSKWYERNIRIFSDIQRLAAPGERILVIFGSGHAAILRELVAADPQLELVDARAYLPPL
jgi:hypothetical protein